MSERRKFVPGMYVVVDHLGYAISTHRTRHDAVGAIATYDDAQDYHVEPMSVVGWQHICPKKQRPVRRRSDVFPRCDHE